MMSNVWPRESGGPIIRRYRRIGPVVRSPTPTQTDAAPDLLAGGGGGTGQAPHGADAIARGRMRGEEPALASRARLTLEPRERAGHQPFAVVAGALEDLHAVRVGLVLLLAAVGAGDELSRNRCDGGGGGKHLIEQDHPNPHAGPQALGLRHVAE